MQTETNPVHSINKPKILLEKLRDLKLKFIAKAGEAKLCKFPEMGKHASKTECNIPLKNFSELTTWQRKSGSQTYNWRQYSTIRELSKSKTLKMLPDHLTLFYDFRDFLDLQQIAQDNRSIDYFDSNVKGHKYCFTKGLADYLCWSQRVIAVHNLIAELEQTAAAIEAKANTMRNSDNTSGLKTREDHPPTLTSPHNIIVIKIRDLLQVAGNQRIRNSSFKSKQTDTLRGVSLLLRKHLSPGLIDKANVPNPKSNSHKCSIS